MKVNYFATKHKSSKYTDKNTFFYFCPLFFCYKNYRVIVYMLWKQKLCRFCGISWLERQDNFCRQLLLLGQVHQRIKNHSLFSSTISWLIQECAFTIKIIGKSPSSPTASPLTALRHNHRIWQSSPATKTLKAAAPLSLSPTLFLQLTYPEQGDVRPCHNLSFLDSFCFLRSLSSQSNYQESPSALPSV